MKNKKYSWFPIKGFFFIIKVKCLSYPRSILKYWNDPIEKIISPSIISIQVLMNDKIAEILYSFMVQFFLDSRKPYPLKSALYWSRWASKTLAIPDSYKKCTPWLKLEICCTNLKSFTITLRWISLSIFTIWKKGIFSLSRIFTSPISLGRWSAMSKGKCAYRNHSYCSTSKLCRHGYWPGIY